MSGERAVPVVVACAAALFTATVVSLAAGSVSAVDRAPAKTTLGPYQPDDSAPPPAALDAFGYVQRLFATIDQPGAPLDTVSAEVAPGSDADLHQQYLARVAVARRSNGQPVTHTVSLDGEDVRVCEAVATALDSSQAPSSVSPSSRSSGAAEECDVYSGFVADVDGRLVEYSTDGVALDGRFGEVTPSTLGPLEVRSGLAFDDDHAVVVVLEVFASLQTVQPHWAEAELRAPAGAATAADSSRTAGPAEIGAGGAASVLLTFPEGELGGTMAVPVDGDLALSSSLMQVAIVPI